MSFTIPPVGKFTNYTFAQLTELSRREQEEREREANQTDQSDAEDDIPVKAPVRSKPVRAKSAKGKQTVTTSVKQAAAPPAKRARAPSAKPASRKRAKTTVQPAVNRSVLPWPQSDGDLIDPPSINLSSIRSDDQMIDWIDQFKEVWSYHHNERNERLPNRTYEHAARDQPEVVAPTRKRSSKQSSSQSSEQSTSQRKKKPAKPVGPIDDELLSSFSINQPIPLKFPHFTQSISLSSNQSIKQTINQSINQTIPLVYLHDCLRLFDFLSKFKKVLHFDCSPVIFSFETMFTALTSSSNNQSNNQTINQSSQQSNSHLINHSIDHTLVGNLGSQSDTPSIDQSDKQSNNQSNNPDNWLVDSIGASIMRCIYRLDSRSHHRKKLTYQSNDQSSNPVISQLTWQKYLCDFLNESVINPAGSQPVNRTISLSIKQLIKKHKKQLQFIYCYLQINSFNSLQIHYKLLTFQMLLQSCNVTEYFKSFMNSALMQNLEIQKSLRTSRILTVSDNRYYETNLPIVAQCVFDLVIAVDQEHNQSGILPAKQPKSKNSDFTYENCLSTGLQWNDQRNTQAMKDLDNRLVDCAIDWPLRTEPVGSDRFGNLYWILGTDQSINPPNDRSLHPTTNHLINQSRLFIQHSELYSSKHPAPFNQTINQPIKHLSSQSSQSSQFSQSSQSSQSSQFSQSIQSLKQESVKQELVKSESAKHEEQSSEQLAPPATLQPNHHSRPRAIEWSMIKSRSEFDTLIGWLNEEGIREKALKETLMKYHWIFVDEQASNNSSDQSVTQMVSDIEQLSGVLSYKKLLEICVRKTKVSSILYDASTNQITRSYSQSSQRSSPDALSQQSTTQSINDEIRCELCQDTWNKHSHVHCMDCHVLIPVKHSPFGSDDQPTDSPELIAHLALCKGEIDARDRAFRHYHFTPSAASDNQTIKKSAFEVDHSFSVQPVTHPAKKSKAAAKLSDDDLSSDESDDSDEEDQPVNPPVIAPPTNQSNGPPADQSMDIDKDPEIILKIDGQPITDSDADAIVQPVKQSTTPSPSPVPTKHREIVAYRQEPNNQSNDQFISLSNTSASFRVLKALLLDIESGIPAEAVRAKPSTSQSINQLTSQAVNQSRMAWIECVKMSLSVRTLGFLLLELFHSLKPQYLINQSGVPLSVPPINQTINHFGFNPEQWVRDCQSINQLSQFASNLFVFDRSIYYTEEERESSSNLQANQSEDEYMSEDLCRICHNHSASDQSVMLICDGCDGNFHAKCAKVRKIPDGDWFCSDCKIHQSNNQTNQSKSKSKSSSKSKKTSQSISQSSPPDYGICVVCQLNEGDPLLCDECDSAYHLNCLDPPLTEVPEGDWFCPHCARDHVADDMTDQSDDDDRRTRTRSSNRASNQTNGLAPLGDQETDDEDEYEPNDQANEDDEDEAEYAPVPVKPKRSLNRSINDDEDEPCTVCFTEDPESEQSDNPVLLCDGCDHAVHVQCQGLSQVPEEDPWYCDVCRSNDRSNHPSCMLCEKDLSHGMMREVDGRWVHLSCACYTPNVHFQDPETRQGIEIDLPSIQQLRHGVCSACKLSRGVTLTCQASGCRERMHVVCALANKTYQLKWDESREPVQLVVRCPRHVKH